jgi:hypothetical protein
MDRDDNQSTIWQSQDRDNQDCHNSGRQNSFQYKNLFVDNSSIKKNDMDISQGSKVSLKVYAAFSDQL